MRVAIRSYDHLTDQLAERQFYSLPLNFSVELEELDVLKRNQLANPFVKAFSSAAWSRIVKSVNIEHKHMLALNADLLLSNRELNAKHTAFLSDWANLPATQKERYWEEIRLIHRL